MSLDVYSLTLRVLSLSCLPFKRAIYACIPHLDAPVFADKDAMGGGEHFISYLRNAKHLFGYKECYIVIDKPSPLL